MQQIRTKDGTMVSILDVTAENYLAPKGSEMSYHCRIEQRKFDSNTGKRLSVPRIQMFGKKEFDNGLLHHLRQQGYTVDILHDPNEWIKANQDRIAKEQAENEARRKAEAEKAAKERREAEMAAMQEEIMAKLRAEGWAPKSESKTSKKK